MRILIIEDDPQIATNLQSLLTKSGAFAADIALTGREGETKSLDESYDLIILDWILPDMDGLSIIKLMREAHLHTPILMLTARTQPEDKVEGLNSGADDYITKPFDKSELLARVRALLRRRHLPTTPPLLTISDLTIDTNSHETHRSGNRIDLSPKEYSLLEFLARSQCQVLDRLEILSHVWDESTDPFSNTVDVHIRFLRRKIDDHYSPKLIHTVRGKGYSLCANLHSPPKSHS